ncbi:MAG: hypothetical protein ACAH80_15475 [Alphaproteobacteria bacterium]
MRMLYGEDQYMRGVIFDSMISTTVTMPAMILLGVMAAYWLRRRHYPAVDPLPGSFAFLAALLPLALMVVLWPSGSVSSSKTTMITCTYVVYYFVGALLYAVCRQVEEEGRARVFRFFFLLFSAAVIVSLLLSFRLIGGLMYFIMLVGVAATVVWLVLRLIPDRGPVWTWTPPPASEPVDVATPEPASAPMPASFGNWLVCGLSILVIVWLCAYVASFRPLYAVLVLCWTGIAGFALARRNEADVTPSPSPPSQETG